MYVYYFTGGLVSDTIIIKYKIGYILYIVLQTYMPST